MKEGESVLCCCSCAVALADTDRQQADPPHQRKGVRWRDAARGGQGKGEAEGNGGSQNQFYK